MSIEEFGFPAESAKITGPVRWKRWAQAVYQKESVFNKRDSANRIASPRLLRSYIIMISIPQNQIHPPKPLVIASSRGRARESRGTSMPAVILLMIASLLGAGCSDSSETVDVPAIESNSHRISVVYQRAGNLFVKRDENEPTLLLRGASYPRWSPDGRYVVAVRGNDIVMIDAARNSSLRVLARADDPRAVAWDASGKRVYFTDGDRVRVVDTDGNSLRTVLKGYRVLEFDVDRDARHIVATVKRFGYHIRLFDLETGKSRKLVSGCSASFSPDGDRITNLVDGHRQLELLDTSSGKTARTLDAPRGIKYDNHFWTNDPEWIAGETEGDRRDIVLINARDGRVRSVTSNGAASRGDVHIGG